VWQLVSRVRNNAFALLAETIPARHRSWLMVLIGGDVAGAYIVTSLLASTLEPRFGWRVLWLIGLPTGVLLILLNRWIPESPRFLLASGRADEAEAVMARFGARLVREDPAARSEEEPGRYVQLFRRPLGGLTTAVVLFGLGWGLVNSGFLLWLPTNLRQLGLETGASERLLAGAAIIGFPAVFAVALLYGFWSSKRTMIGVVLLTSATLFAFVALGRRVGDHPHVLQALIVLLLVGTNSILPRGADAVQLGGVSDACPGPGDRPGGSLRPRGRAAGRERRRDRAGPHPA
jgi:putative MFS transporter